MVNVNVAGRRYDIRCEPGAEDRLRALAFAVDARAKRLAAEGVSGEGRLLLLTALMLAEELDAAAQRLAAVEATNLQLEGELASLEGRAAEILEGVIARIDEIGESWADGA